MEISAALWAHVAQEGLYVMLHITSLLLSLMMKKFL